MFPQPHQERDGLLTLRGNHPRSRFPKKRMGFTLVELLAVLAVIAVLFALLFPVLGRMRANAAQAQCVSNIKHLSSQLLLLSAEKNFRLDTFAGGSGHSTEIWPRQLRDQLGLLPTPKLYYSPHTINDIPENLKSEGALFWRTSYALNLSDPDVCKPFSIEGGGRITAMKTIHFTRINEPARYPLIVTHLNPNIPMTGRFDFSSLEVNTLRGVHLIHGGRANAAFADGHVEALGPEELSRLGFKNGFDAEGNSVTFP